MIVKVHCGTILGDKFAAMLKMRTPSLALGADVNSPKVFLDPLYA